jgi:CheY-like chemotaxis protein
MLSSTGTYGDVDRCRRLGVNQYMIKPVTMTDLREAIGKALGVWRTSGAAISALVAAPDESARRRILLAEDNPVNQAFALGILEQWGVAATVGRGEGIPRSVGAFTGP